jgi:hypothetical protein
MTINADNAAQTVMEGYKEFAANALVAPGPAAAAAAPDFCALWPKAKPVLQFLVGLIALLPIPGGGLAAGGILTGLIALGDQLYKQKCGGGALRGGDRSPPRGLTH